MNALISDIKRFAIHDGDGIRTTVFFKGCPLKCIWCHNPESISFKPQLAYYQNKCIGCSECSKICETSAHIITKDTHIFDKSKCSLCGKCEDICLGDALKFYGKKMSVQDLLETLREDKDFFDTSGGGVTLSGGECLTNADFCTELLRALKNEGINTAIDTCGYVPRENFDKVLEFTDTFLYDIKAIDKEVHMKCTGKSNELILDNLKYIDSMGKNIEIRIPYVPEYNADQIPKIKKFLKELKNVTKVKILPYHNYAGSKYLSLDMENTLPTVLPTQDEIEIAEKIFK